MLLDFNKSKISFKLALAYFGMFLLTLIFLDIVVYFSLQGHIVAKTSREIKATTRTLLYEFVEKDKPKKSNFYDKDLLAEILKDQNVSVNIINNKYDIINTSELSYVNKIPLGEPYNKIEKITIGKTRFIYINSKVSLSKNSVFYIQTFKDTRDEDSFLRMLLKVIIFTGIIGISLAIFVGTFISKKTLEPINKIATTAQNITVNNLHERIETNNNNDEISKLTNIINDMIDRLQKSFALQSKFVSDASHELRTPISVISGNINMLDRWGKNDTEVLNKSINVVKNEISYMTAMLENLLFLARGDSEAVKLEKKQFYLNELIEDLIEETRFLTSSHKVIFHESKIIDIYSDERLIKQALRAIIENSIKYTPPGGTILIQCFSENNSISISIKDSGIGMKPEDIPNLFNRFYRSDLVSNTKGSGLGLSVVKSIMDILKGNITIKSDLNAGTEVILSIQNKMRNK